eukprot:TRINITY_DN13356_c0_g1_i4.p1 TRINITY_DN13356_c0_g1~~TRINITY_DN13356_c0_g1_i4.p1  ORF type:complete len:149 (+),score=26.59 TRINITY_DN13356_c0_g1_i4:487-933(+)
MKTTKFLLDWLYDNDTTYKIDFFPRLSKQQLHTMGFISDNSPQSRGSAVAVTIVSGPSQDPLPSSPSSSPCTSDDRYRDNSLDMGTNFDCLDNQSFVNASGLNFEQRKNRKLLQDLMRENKFEQDALRWWLFTLRNEPFTNNYNFVVE